MISKGDNLVIHNEAFVTDILNNWLEFTKPEDDNEKCINLNSWDYTFRRYNEKITKLTEAYNIPNEITIVYLKNLFNWFLEKASISLSDLFNNRIDLSCTKRLFELFSSEELKRFENSFYNALDRISVRISKNNLIGKDIYLPGFEGSAGKNQ